MSTQIGVQFGTSEMERPLRVVEILVAVSRLPEGPRRVRDVRYESQKEHWWVGFFTTKRRCSADLIAAGLSPFAPEAAARRVAQGDAVGRAPAHAGAAGWPRVREHATMCVTTR